MRTPPWMIEELERMRREREEQERPVLHVPELPPRPQQTRDEEAQPTTSCVIVIDLC